jgi:hypothetical protein
MFWNNIPKEPHLYYAKFGFTNYKDWLGTHQLGHKDRVYRYFKSARKYVRGLKLKNQYDWVQFSKSKKRPYDIPSNPQQKYANEWIGLGDWLGTKTIATQLRAYKTFDDARIFARKLKINNVKEWRLLYLRGKIPKDIPKTPYQTYEKHWKGWADFLGKE